MFGGCQTLISLWIEKHFGGCQKFSTILIDMFWRCGRTYNGFGRFCYHFDNVMVFYPSFNCWLDRVDLFHNNLNNKNVLLDDWKVVWKAIVSLN
jgi:hypothetical protein